jgi:serine protease inhibitor
VYCLLLLINQWVDGLLPKNVANAKYSAEKKNYYTNNKQSKILLTVVITRKKNILISEMRFIQHFKIVTLLCVVGDIALTIFLARLNSFNQFEKNFRSTGHYH